MNNTNVVDSLMIITGLAYSLDNMQTLLGVILLVMQLCWLLAKLIVKIVSIVKKKGSINEAEQEFGDVVDFVQDTLDKIEETKETKGDDK